MSWRGKFCASRRRKDRISSSVAERPQQSNKQKKGNKMATFITTSTHPGTGLCQVVDNQMTIERVNSSTNFVIHLDNVYNALFNAVETLENRLATSLKTYQEHPDVQANLQQLQYDLQQWNLALTTMTNINKNMGDALNSIASNFR